MATAAIAALVLTLLLATVAAWWAARGIRGVAVALAWLLASAAAGIITSAWLSAWLWSRPR